MKNNLLIIFIVCICFSCKKSTKAGGGGNTNPPVPNSDFAKGADISWLTQMEATGRKFYNSAGEPKGLYADFERPWNEFNPVTGMGQSIRWMVQYGRFGC